MQKLDKGACLPHFEGFGIASLFEPCERVLRATTSMAVIICGIIAAVIAANLVCAGTVLVSNLERSTGRR